MALPAPDPPICEVYIDESSKQHRYLTLGAVLIPRVDSDVVHTLVAKARLPELPRNEMKWIKVSRAKLPAYKRVADAFFDYHRRNTWDFHCIVIDTTKQKHRIYNQGSREIGFNKEVYQLALKCGSLYRALFHVYPDRRQTNQRPEDLRVMLNRGLRQKGDTRDWPYRRVQFRDSHTTPLLQLADIFAGAIAYRLNRHHEAPDASPSKVELSAYILERAGVRDVARDTSRSGKFTIWHRVLR